MLFDNKLIQYEHRTIWQNSLIIYFKLVLHVFFQHLFSQSCTFFKYPGNKKWVKPIEYWLNFRRGSASMYPSTFQILCKALKVSNWIPAIPSAAKLLNREERKLRLKPYIQNSLKVYPTQYIFLLYVFSC